MFSNKTFKYLYILVYLSVVFWVSFMWNGAEDNELALITQVFVTILSFPISLPVVYLLPSPELLQFFKDLEIHSFINSFDCYVLFIFTVPWVLGYIQWFVVWPKLAQKIKALTDDPRRK